LFPQPRKLPWLKLKPLETPRSCASMNGTVWKVVFFRGAKTFLHSKCANASFRAIRSFPRRVKEGLSHCESKHLNDPVPAATWHSPSFRHAIGLLREFLMRNRERREKGREKYRKIKNKRYVRERKRKRERKRERKRASRGLL